MPERPEFSRLVPLDRLAGGRLSEHIVAGPRERAALARRFDLQGLEHLEAAIEIRPGQSRDLIAMTGRLSAEVTQTCVVTLEPVSSRLDQPIDLLFSLGPPPGGEEIFLDPAEPDWPEPVPREGLDIGEVTAQLLSLALDPYPRRPGATLAQALDEAGLPPEEDAEASPEGGPFAALAGLARRTKGGEGKG